MTIRRRPQSRAERIIAASRLFLALASFGAIYLDPLEPSLYPAFTYGLLAAYALYAIAVAIWTALSPVTSQEWLIVSHLIDLTVFGSINYMTFGPTSPFFIYFVFSIICAMLRFGRQGTMLTAAAALIVFVASSAGRVGAMQFELNRFIIRLSYLGVMASMLIYLAAYQDRVQRDLRRLVRWPRSPTSEQDELVMQLMEEASSIFGAKRVLLAYAYLSSRYAFLGERGAAGFDATIESAAVADLLLDQHVDDAGIADDAADEHESDETTLRESAGHRGVPPAIVESFTIDEVVATSFRGEIVRGRLLLLDSGVPLLEEINLAKIAGGIIAGRLDHYHALQQLRRGAVAEERVRVARDLHDSVLQSLTGVALQLRTLPKLMTVDTEAARRRFEEIEQVLVTGQKELRLFIEELRPGGLRGSEGGGLSDRLSTLAARFREQWGIDVENEISPVVHLLPVETRYEIYAIVNEAVANAAKHAGARRVRVAVDAGNNAARIDIQDDGRGFPFHGRYTLEELVAAKRGPVTLKERVAALQGTLLLDSSPAGSLIAIRLPLHSRGV